ncbi:FtsX-like permease family protein [Pontibacter sp. G13]|uniref:FtsX-like permease family protein n=1 Tax=Pontibacter sp. G13 TaxID=3074898 RepID=UPI00288C29DF|nr:FtsX-like permease family protein [Pontibacter sp. G13]WNJ18527.1 FtsX-like permease family protein [Pontibacter sp. G13]
MNVKFTIAKRYLFGKKSSNAINVISWVAMIGIGVGVAALILVLSVFNGLTSFIEDLFAGVDPDIKIVASSGFHFEHDEELYEQLAKHPKVAAITRTVEGKVGFEYVDNQVLGTLKGVESSEYLAVNPLDSSVYVGEFGLARQNGVQQAVFGASVAAGLSADLHDEILPITVFYIPQKASMLNPQKSIRTDRVFPSGFFSIQKEYDETLVVSDFEFVQNLFRLKNQVSSYEIRLKNIDDASAFKEEIQPWLGENLEALTWFEQHITLYKVMRNEKYISYLILVLILAIAAVNIVGSLYMIVLEKKRDIAILMSMGTTSSFIRGVFQQTGLLVGAVGGMIGVLLALIAGLAQKYLKLIKLNGGESFRVDAFPIEMQFGDFALVFVTVLLLAWIASLYPSNKASSGNIVEGLSK